MFLLLSPFFLLGLFIAALLHILVSKKQMFKVGGDPGMKGVAIAAALGTPLPLCSCGVAPIAVELKRKGAKDPAIISFLITTPETGVDSIAVTWGLLGPIMAIARPIAAYVMGIFGGFLAIGLLREPPIAEKKLITSASEMQVEQDLEIHDPHAPIHVMEHMKELEEEDDDYVGFKGLFRSITSFPKRVYQRVSNTQLFYSWYHTPELLPPPMPVQPSSAIPLREIGKRLFGAIVHLADDILPSLMIGLLITFFIFLILPSNLADYGFSGGFLPYLVMLAAGIPVYVCASASTPIAAALVYKGLNPGAALVFLLTGPATNITTFSILARYFGSKFVNIYLWSVVIGGLAAGVLFDYLLHIFDWHVKANYTDLHNPIAGIFEWTSAILLIILMVYRYFYGNLKEGFTDIMANLNGFLLKINGIDPLSPWKAHFSIKSRLFRFGFPLVILIYFATGLKVVPIGHLGYVRLFDHVIQRDLQPGLYYIPPWPFAYMDTFSPTYPRQINIVMPVNKSLTKEDSEQRAEFISGGTDMIDMAVSVDYFISDPYRYFYQLREPEKMVSDYLTSSTRDAVATGQTLLMMTEERERLENRIEKKFLSHVGKEGKTWQDLLGIHVLSINIVHIQPPQESLFSFRDVVSAQQDRETYTLNALGQMINIVLKSQGDSAVEIDRALANAYSEKVKAAGSAQSIIAQAEVIGKNRDILEELLWLETSERVLSGRELLFLPPGAPPQKFTLWKGTTPHLDQHEKTK